jgi:Flp pilus assembly pilin Flp
MTKWLRRLLKNQRGQAMAEYHVLIPGSILMVLAAFVLVADPVKRMYCDAVGLFQSGVCRESEVASLGGGGADEETPTPEPTEYCVILTQDEGCSQCDQGDCTCLPGTNSGMYTGSGDIGSLVIKAGVEYHIYYSGVTEDGCYDVSIDGNMASWTKVGNGSYCKDVSHLESWYTPVCK